MIFINKKGQAKVWLHPNLSKNYPYNDKNENNLAFNNNYDK